MTNAISAISTSAVNAAAVSSSSGLSEDTKKKLEALGVDTSNITTEAQGQTKLKEAQMSQAASQAAPAQGQQPQQTDSSMETIQNQIEDFASKVGVSISDSDTVDDILNNLTAKISELKSAAMDDPIKKAEADSFQTRYSELSNSYSQAESSQSMLTSSMEAMANYNKVALSL